jgi:outer membrane murein-binding lipoprotein Lpp
VNDKKKIHVAIIGGIVCALIAVATVTGCVVVEYETKIAELEQDISELNKTVDILQANVNKIPEATPQATTAAAATKTVSKAERTKAKYIKWDSKFQELSNKNRKKFIKYFIRYYSKKMGVNVNVNMAIRHAIKETSLGRAGQGRAHKKNLFGFMNSYTGSKFKTYRAACKAFVKYTKHYYPDLARSGKNGRMYQ